MKLAISNIGFVQEDDEKVYQLMKEYDFSGLEIAPTRIFPENPYDKCDAARQWASELFNEYDFIIPSMQSIWYGRSENIFESDTSRQLLIDYSKKAILFAEAISCNNLVFGCPRNRNVPDGIDSSLADSFFLELAQFANGHNTVIGMEANPPIYNTNYINDTASAIELIKRIDSQGLRLNLDLGTMIYLGEDVDILENRVKYINHVHISEPYLKLIEQRELHKRIKDILCEEGYKGYISIEMGKDCGLAGIQSTMEYVKEIFE